MTPDGARIVSGSDDNTVRLWELFPTGQTLMEKAKNLVQHCLTPAQRKLVYLMSRVLTKALLGKSYEANTNR